MSWPLCQQLQDVFNAIADSLDQQHGEAGGYGGLQNPAVGQAARRIGDLVYLKGIVNERNREDQHGDGEWKKQEQEYGTL